MLWNKAAIIVLVFSILFLIYINENTENFENSASKASQLDIASGSSGYYNWGYKEIPDETADHIPHVKHKCHNPRCNKPCYIPVPYKKKTYSCPHCEEKINVNTDIFLVKSQDCKTCDITKNKDIDKYVLKSSIPPYPDMSQYVKKSSLHPDGPGGHGGGHHGKDCPKCPICPICPKCEGPSQPIDNIPSQVVQRPLTPHEVIRKSGGYTMDVHTEDDLADRTSNDYDKSTPNMGYAGSAPGGTYVTRTGQKTAAAKTPSAFEGPFSYNNRSSGKVHAYNRFNPDWGQSTGWGNLM